MKFIEQNAVIWGECPVEKNLSIEWIERAGRVCYRSEDKIVDGSGIDFVQNIWDKTHFSVIEQSNIVMRPIEKNKFPLNALQTIRMTFNSPFFRFFIQDDYVYIAGNWRTWIEFYETCCEHEEEMSLSNIFHLLSNGLYEIVKDSSEIPLSLRSYTVEFNTNRAMSHELVRHRPASYSQESQRYCRYGDILYIKPIWFDKSSDEIKMSFNQSCKTAEVEYQWMINNGMSPQNARNVLNNATATKIIMTASQVEWNHVFNLRCGGGADPQMIDLMTPVRDKFIENKWL